MPFSTIYIPNFNFLAQFEEELYEKQTQNIKKLAQKITFMDCNRSIKVDLGHLLNVHTKFQFPNFIWKSLMRKLIQKIKPPAPHLQLHFSAVRGRNGSKKLKPQKYTSMSLAKCTYQISIFQLNLERC